MKRKINRKKIAVAVAAALIAGMTTAGIVAAPRFSTTATTKMNTTEMGIRLNAEEQKLTAMPGSEFDYPASVTNTGDYTSYLRVRVNKSWYDGEKKITEEKGKELDPSLIRLLRATGENPQAMTEIQSGSSGAWKIRVDDNGEDVYFYYLQPVAPGDGTDNFMDGYRIGNISNSEQDLYTDKQIHLALDADAIQVPENSDGSVNTEKAMDAILSEWGLEVYEMDAQTGTIIDMETD